MIPKRLREGVGLRAGPIEMHVEGGGIRIEPPAEEALVERDGLLVIPAGGLELGDEDVRALRDADRR